MKRADSHRTPPAQPLQLQLALEPEHGEPRLPVSPAITPVLLCGGTGARLWPLSRRSLPEPFVPLAGGHSPMAQALQRLGQLGPPHRSVLCVVPEAHRFLALEALKASRLAARLLLEPEARGTAAAIALAALASPADALLLLCPADHQLPDASTFVETVQRAVGAAQAGAIVCFGVVPSAPSSVHGYLELGAQRPDGSHSVLRLTDQPAPAKARRLLVQGGVLWNAGLYLASADTLLHTLAQLAPDVLHSCQAAMSAAGRGTVPAADHPVSFMRPHASHYLACRTQRFDLLLASARPLVVWPMAGRWSQLGSWKAVAALAPRDAKGNHVHGQGHTLQARNTYVHASHRTVLALGTQDLVIVDTPDALLVAHRDHTDQLSAAMEQLQDGGTPLASAPQKINYPWGWQDSVSQGAHHRVRRIGLQPGASLGPRKHHHRAEHWIVVHGTAEVSRGSERFLLAENQSAFVPAGETYRLHNPGRVELEMVEVQSGRYLGEDDTVPLDGPDSAAPEPAAPTSPTGFTTDPAPAAAAHAQR